MNDTSSIASQQFSALLRSLETKTSPVVSQISQVLIDQLRLGRIAIPVSDFDESEQWLADALQSSMIGEAGEFMPIIYHAGFFYLYRYWDYQQRLWTSLQQRLQLDEQIDADQRTVLKTALDEAFRDNAEAAVDWQKYAAASALLRRFLIISGGPGTGKTTTVAKILRLLAKQFQLQYQRLPRVVLAAPTGKAAMRMQESLREQADEALTALLENEAATLHRVLGYLPNRVDFRHHANNPLPADIVIVDEASMIDLALLTKLIEAVSPQARLILLGDKDQLPSVETGSVFRDLCLHAMAEPAPERVEQVLALQSLPSLDKPSSRLQQAIVMLQRSYRFDTGSGIGQLAKAVKRGDGQQVQQLLEDDLYSDIQWLDLSAFQQQFVSLILDAWQAYFALLKQQSTPQALFEAFSRFRVLTALRVGLTGVENINDLIESQLQKRFIKGYSPYYHGRPIMITRNHYATGLFNGDIGLMLKNAQGELRVWFQTQQGVWQDFPLSRLPSHETAWVMTIHKSQGSEFDHVLMVLPDVDNTVLSRELVYTGITRAKQSLILTGSVETLCLSLQRQQMRSTGL